MCTLTSVFIVAHIRVQVKNFHKFCFVDILRLDKRDIFDYTR